MDDGDDMEEDRDANCDRVAATDPLRMVVGPFRLRPTLPAWILSWQLGMSFSRDSLSALTLACCVAC